MTYKTLEDLLKELNVQADPFKTYKTPKQWLKELNVQADPSIIARLIADAQRWLDLKYPVKQEVKEIIHDNEMEKSLIGELVIKDFPKLKKISFIGSGDIFKIEIVNCPQLDDFECVGSPVKEIDFGSSNKLERIYIPDNLLESIKLPANPTGLVKLSAHNNKLSSRTLQTLAPFTKNIPLPFGAPDDMTMTYYEYSAKDKEKLKNILSKQESQTTESSSSSTISQIQPKKESEKKSVAQLEKEHTFYKNFFDNYLQNKKTELIKLKDKMGKEDKKQLDDYLQLKQSEDKNKNRERKLKKCLLKKLYSEELLQKILDINKEINKLENQVNEIELKSKIAVPQTS